MHGKRAARPSAHGLHPIWVRDGRPFIGNAQVSRLFVLPECCR
jgi:hypothetical protein